MTPDMTVALNVQREPGQAAVIHKTVIYGLAFTLAMPREAGLYDEVRARVAPPVRATVWRPRRPTSAMPLPASRIAPASRAGTSAGAMRATLACGWHRAGFTLDVRHPKVSFCKPGSVSAALTRTSSAPMYTAIAVGSRLPWSLTALHMVATGRVGDVHSSSKDDSSISRSITSCSHKILTWLSTFAAVSSAFGSVSKWSSNCCDTSTL